MSVFPELGFTVTNPVPAILTQPALSHVAQQDLGSRHHTRAVVTGFVSWLPFASPLTEHGHARAAAWTLLHHPIRERYRLLRLICGPGNKSQHKEYLLMGVVPWQLVSDASHCCPWVRTTSREAPIIISTTAAITLFAALGLATGTVITECKPR